MDIAEQAVKRSMPNEYRFEDGPSFTDWTDFRHCFTQDFEVWAFLTWVTISFGADDTVLGWEIEKRKRNTGTVPLPAETAELLARRCSLVTPDLALDRVNSSAAEDGGVFTNCRFVSPDARNAVSVRINTQSGQIVFVMPELSDFSTLLPIDDADALRRRQQASELVQSLTAERLAPVDPADWQQALRLTIEAGQARPGGERRYRFGVWSYFSAVVVRIDAASGELLSWSVEALRDDATENMLSAEQAIREAKVEFPITTDFKGPEVAFDEDDLGHWAVVSWWHRVADTVVEGDHLTVVLNGATGKMCSVSRQWHEVPHELLKEPILSERQAVQRAAEESQRLGLPPGTEPARVDKAIIRVAEDEENPSPVRTCAVWRVGYKIPTLPSFMQIAVDQQTGAVVRVTGW